MAKLYVARVNLIANIYNLYKDNNINIMKEKIASSIPDVCEYTHKITKFVKNKPIEEENKYTIFISDRKDMELYGTLVREGKIHYKTLDKKSRRYNQHSPEVAEEISFLYDIKLERIAFNIKSRFKYKQFIEGMSGIINKCMIENNLNYIFELSMCTTGINVESLKESLNEISHITELEFKFQLPNPDEEELKEIKENPERYIEGLVDGNIDDFSNIFRSRQGIKIDSKPINESLDMANKIHTSIPGDIAFRNGYVKVNAISSDGIHYSSEEDGIFTREIDELKEFKEFCKETILITKRR